MLLKGEKKMKFYNTPTQTDVGDVANGNNKKYGMLPIIMIIAMCEVLKTYTNKKWVIH